MDDTKHTPGPWRIHALAIGPDGRPTIFPVTVERVLWTIERHDGLDEAAERMSKEEAERRLNVHDDLLAALKDTVLCLTEHLSQEAHEKGVRVEELCPCATIQLAAARDAIARATAQQVAR